VRHDPSQLLVVQKEFAMTNALHFFSLVMAVAGVTSAFSTSAAAQTTPPDLPAAIMCYAQADQSWRIGYLYRVNKDGDALYLSADGGLGATVDAKGVVLEPTDRPAGLDCYGQTLDELRSNSRTLEFQRTK
jgi:hypothetical protein